MSVTHELMGQGPEKQLLIPKETQILQRAAVLVAAGLQKQVVCVPKQGLLCLPGGVVQGDFVKAAGRGITEPMVHRQVLDLEFLQGPFQADVGAVQSMYFGEREDIRLGKAQVHQAAKVLSRDGAGIRKAVVIQIDLVGQVRVILKIPNSSHGKRPSFLWSEVWNSTRIPARKRFYQKKSLNFF